MSLVVTPRQLNQRAEFYHQLAQLTAAGIGLLSGLEQLKRNPPSRSYREPVEKLLHELTEGRTFAASLQQLGGWLPEFDIALIDAGERSGRLDACFRLLADYYRDQARVIQQMISRLLYPVGVIHLAVLIFIVVLPFARSQFSASIPVLLAKAALALAPLYAVTAFVIYAMHSRQGEKWRALVESLLGWMPILGSARHYLALARFAAALEALISAGVNIIQALDLAGNASGSIAVRRAVAAMKPEVVAGMTPAEAMRKHAIFPDMFTNLYNSGEVSGKLDETLKRLYAHYHEEGSHKLQMFAQWLPRLVYGIVAALVIYGIVQTWNGLYGPQSELSNIINEK